MSNFIVKCRAIKRIMNKCRKSCHNCTKFEASQMENMPYIIPVELIGENLQVCLDNLFETEVVERNCPNCPSSLARKQIETVLEPEIIIFQMKSKQETQSRPCRLVL